MVQLLSTLVQVMTWWHKAISCYLDQCWLIAISLVFKGNFTEIWPKIILFICYESHKSNEAKWFGSWMQIKKKYWQSIKVIIWQLRFYKHEYVGHTKSKILYMSLCHYSDVIMGVIASEIASLKIFCSTVYTGTDQRKHQSSASLAFVRGIHRWPVNSSHKWPVTQTIVPIW